MPDERLMTLREPPRRLLHELRSQEELSGNGLR